MNKVALVAGAVLLAVVLSGCVFNVTSYRDNDGSLVYVGEVQNGDGSLASPNVTGTFFDGAGNVVATKTAGTCQVLNPKGVTAFKVVLPAGTVQPARVEWKLDGTAVDNAYLAEGLTAELVSSGPGLPSVFKPAHFGEMKNNSSNAYIGGSGCVAWLNAKGEVLRVADIDAAGLRFNPGDTLPFVAREDVPADAASVTFFLDSGVTPPGQPRPVIIDIPNSQFTNLGHPLGNGAPFSFVFGKIHNTTANAILPEIIATTHDSKGTLNGVGTSTGLCGVPAPAGGFTYSGYEFTSAAVTGTSPDVKIQASVADQATSSALVTLPVSGVTKSAGSAGITTVRGSVKNNSSNMLSIVRVCAAALDASGNVISVLPGRPTLPSGGLAPGASATFSIDVTTFTTPASVDAIAAGRASTGG